ncbi:MAG: gamma-glutamyl-gamma-aminobutyrate hydrolase family protein [Acidimicrobiia bacterium]
MSARPLIGITGRRWSLAALGDRFPAGYQDGSFDLHVTDYSAAVAAAGGLPVQLSPDAEPEALADRLDGVVFSGGADLDPARYGSAPHPELGAVEPARDRFELALLEAAMVRRRPVLGICRGHQLLNVWAGGTLCQHVGPEEGDGHPRFGEHRARRSHAVRLSEGSVARRLYGPEVEVNSLHHQTVDVIGAELLVTGRSPDGTVEVLEHPRLPVLSVQWHPEALQPPDPSVAWLVREAVALRPSR